VITTIPAAQQAAQLCAVDAGVAVREGLQTREDATAEARQRYEAAVDAAVEGRDAILEAELVRHLPGGGR
jgi:hypothetical protein